jgi:hypothetical protein
VAKWRLDIRKADAMKLLLAALLWALPYAALAEPPSRESLERLLRGMEAEQMVKNVQQYSESMMKGTVDRVAQVRPITPEQRRKLEANSARSSATMRDELSWDKMKPMYMQIYTESFTQEEVDGLIAFYESPAGRAFIAKMPVVLNKSMALMQSRIDAMMRETQAGIKETLEAK